MGWARKLLWAGLFAALILLGSRTLVRGPEESLPPLPPMPQQAAQGVLLPAAQGDQPQQARPQQAQHRETAITQQPMSLPEGEDRSVGCGWHVTSGGWVRSAYNLCPPDGSPG